MNRDLFLSRHGKEWAQIKDDLLLLVEKESPAWDAYKLPLETMDKINVTFTATLAGFGKCRAILSNLGDGVQQEPEEPATFETAPEEIVGSNTLPKMPPPKKSKTKRK